MQCKADRHYQVVREWGEWQHWWAREGKEPQGDIKALRCGFCDFFIKRGHVKRSKSGLGGYNRMRAIMVAHLHKEHRAELEGDEDGQGHQ